MTSAFGDETFFELAPIPMWIEDFSGIRALFDTWRAEGVTDLKAFLEADPARVAACSGSIRILAVNRRTLELFEAESLEHLVAHIDLVFRDEMLTSHISELCQLWDGQTNFLSHAVNYTLRGRRLDIQLRGQILPGHEERFDRLLLTTEDVTPREAARRAEARHRAYAEGIFEHSPVSLWVEDFSQIKILLDDLRDSGIEDLRVFTDVHPEFVQRCMSEIKVIDINQATLDLFCAPDRATLLQSLGEIFRGDMEAHFREQLIELWNGRLLHHREVVNYALDGSQRYVLLQFSVLPGHEEDWALVQVALTDITARKKAEAYLEYLGRHDVLTKLRNRAFYMDEVKRLQRKTLRPVSAVIIDLNGLKEANDTLGHEAGDSLLRRMGEVLNGVVSPPNQAARIGGDEFAVLLPGADRQAAAAIVDTIYDLLKINNQFYSDLPVSIALGVATTEPGETIEAVLRRADLAMYEHKRALQASGQSTKTARKYG
ncbi:histidine kinase [Xaviernesmea oryzae]|uniref:Histidine kinase n=1 Tax=Xaviernesmea oryzae TaxID=464029 RepID=A0A1Q9AUA9_9HYPH|nr:sensor domain-containing diguanylate cyclase [Xaviernesmea oryzae]OLP58952.1 histidine kinase [Xaviernesmea oryzae]SEM03445.1 diguanylate cyclase (GGDEF) domain-containing protein [Xaviernesmea oryzae]